MAYFRIVRGGSRTRKKEKKRRRRRRRLAASRPVTLFEVTVLSVGVRSYSQRDSSFLLLPLRLSLSSSPLRAVLLFFSPSLGLRNIFLVRFLSPSRCPPLSLCLSLFLSSSLSRSLNYSLCRYAEREANSKSGSLVKVFLAIGLAWKRSVFPARAGSPAVIGCDRAGTRKRSNPRLAGRIRDASRRQP